ncbi:MAG: hypothetical protein JO023_07525 [Chloroflexi bacterium]|nr:hypothetical protein [Chloroflexota bacterium]
MSTRRGDDGDQYKVEEELEPARVTLGASFAGTDRAYRRALLVAALGLAVGPGAPW